MNRFQPLDLLRGLIMAIMALDHANAFISRTHSSEMWAGAWTRYSDAASFLTRFVSHLCAPGFFFLMGAGIALFAISRGRAGWTESQVRNTLIKRGLLLLVINHLVENPGMLLGIVSGQVQDPGGNPGPVPGQASGLPYLLFSVITGLGLSMIAGGLAIRLPSFAWTIFAVASLLGSALFTPGPEHVSDAYPFPARLLFLPGLSGYTLVLYPFIPWFGITSLGVLFGRWVHRDSAAAFRFAPIIGLASVSAAIALRAAGGFGNLRPPRDESWIEFLNFIKYPPALVFTLLMIGTNLLLLYLLHRFGRPRFLLPFGQAPLFFYLTHIYLYASIGALLFRAGGASRPTLFLIWIAGLVPLYFLCRRYARFKQSKPESSFWRLL